MKIIVLKHDRLLSFLLLYESLLGQTVLYMVDFDSVVTKHTSVFNSITIQTQGV